MHSMPAVSLHPKGKWFAAQSLDNQVLIYGCVTLIIKVLIYERYVSLYVFIYFSLFFFSSSHLRVCDYYDLSSHFGVMDVFICLYIFLSICFQVLIMG